MLESLKGAVKNWWIFLIIGIICIICAIAIFCTPKGGVATLAVILIINLILVGVLGIIFVISNRKEIPAWGWGLILPILSLIAGILLACFPQASMTLVVILCAVGVLVKSIETIAYAISMSSIKGSGWGWSLALGIIGVILSIILFANPLFTGFAAGIFVGIALLIIGIGSISVSVQLSKIKGTAKAIKEEINK